MNAIATYHRDHASVLLDGDIEWPVIHDVVHAIETAVDYYHYTLIELRVRSLGGSNDAFGYLLGRIESWRERGVPHRTRALGRTSSAAALLVALGDERVAEPAATLRFHGASMYRDGDVNAEVAAALNDKLTWANDRMVGRLVDRVLEGPHVPGEAAAQATDRDVLEGLCVGAPQESGGTAPARLQVLANALGKTVDTAIAERDRKSLEHIYGRLFQIDRPISPELAATLGLLDRTAGQDSSASLVHGTGWSCPSSSVPFALPEGAIARETLTRHILVLGDDATSATRLCLAPLVAALARAPEGEVGTVLVLDPSSELRALPRPGPRRCPRAASGLARPRPHVRLARARLRARQGAVDSRRASHHRAHARSRPGKPCAHTPGHLRTGCRSGRSRGAVACRECGRLRHDAAVGAHPPTRRAPLRSGGGPLPVCRHHQARTRGRARAGFQCPLARLLASWRRPGPPPGPNREGRVGAVRQARERGVGGSPRSRRWRSGPQQRRRPCTRGPCRCTDALPQLLDEVDRLWGGGPEVDVSPDVSRAMASIAVIRHMQVEGAYRPLPGERESVYWETHQGPRRPASVERAGLLRRLRTVLLRCEVDPLAVAAAHLDRANELKALGDHDRTREALAEAMRSTARYQGEQARRDHGAVCFAQQRWLEGDAQDALRRLRNLDGEKARELVDAIAARAGSRDVLREAEEGYHPERIVEFCEVAVAHLLAGHNVRAEVVARQICESHPESALAFHTLASVLTELGRNWDAVAPARRALERAEDPTPDRASLARILARIGADGREESVALALDVLKAHDVLTAIPRDVLAELLDLAHYGGADPALSRRIDGYIRAYRAKCDPPPEWLGAAVARQLHGVPSVAAPDWLSELAQAGPAAPAELARLVVERVETLQWWRTLIERDVDAKAGEAHGSFSPEWMPEAARRLARREARTEAVGAALRAAVALGYAEPELDRGYAGSGAPIASACHWTAHLEPVAAFFGDELAIRLRASEVAQASWFSPDLLPEDELLVLLATFDYERVAWIRWAAQCDAIAEPRAISGQTPATRARLERLLEVASLDDDKVLREASWPNRWNDAQPR